MEKLVSILVITYNSSEYIEETLDSIKNQDYKNIELIISDDCSTDKTIDICNSWLKKNYSRFNRVKIVTSPINTGIPSNCNRGLKECKGEWIKLIAGDDLLLSTAISDYMSSITNKDNYVFAKIQSFTMIDNKRKFLEEIPNSKIIPLFDFSYIEQNKALCQLFFPGCSPSIFLKNDVIKKLNYYDEKYKYIEDWPIAFKATKNNIKLSFIDKTTVLYRIHSNNISGNKKENFYNKKYFESLQLFRKNDIYPTLSNWNKIIFFETYLLDMFQYLVITKLLNNKRNILSKNLNSIIKRLRLEKYFKYYDY
jgi:alpha-1,3-rhamnosyltransferase